MSQGPSSSGLRTGCLLCLEPGSQLCTQAPFSLSRCPGLGSSANCSGRRPAQPAVPSLAQPLCAVHSFMTLTMMTKRAHTLLADCLLPPQLKYPKSRGSVGLGTPRGWSPAPTSTLLTGSVHVLEQMGHSLDQHPWGKV